MEIEQDFTVRLQAIVNDQKLSKDEKIEALESLYDHVRDEQPGASHTPLIDDGALHDSVQQIRKALRDLGADPRQ